MTFPASPARRNSHSIEFNELWKVGRSDLAISRQRPWKPPKWSSTFSLPSPSHSSPDLTLPPPHSSSPCLFNSEPRREVGSPRGVRTAVWKEPEWGRPLTKYCVELLSEELMTSAILSTWIMKSLVYEKGLWFLSYLILITILPERSYPCYAQEVLEWESHITFLLSRVLGLGPAQNSLSPQEKSKAFVIKGHRQMAPLAFEANSKGTVSLIFSAMTVRYHRTQIWKWIKGSWDAPPPPRNLLCSLGLCSLSALGNRGVHWRERRLGLSQETSICCHDNLPNWIFKS